MQLTNEEKNMYKQFTPSQRASIDADLASAARWGRVKWIVAGVITFGLLALGLMS